MASRLTLFSKLVLFIAAVLLVGQGLAAWQALQWSQERAVAGEGQRAQAAAATLALSLSGATHQAMVAAWPERYAFTSWADADENVRNLHGRLAAAQKALGTESPITTLHLVDHARQAVIAAPDRVHADAMAFIGTSAERPLWRHATPYKPEMRAALFDGRSVHTGRHDDVRGAWVSAYAPIRAADGSVVALLAVDASLGPVLAQVQQQATRQLVLSLAVFLGVLIAVGSVARRLSTGVAQVEAAVARLVAGDMDTPVSGGGLAGVGVLAEGLEDARVALKRRLGRLTSTRRELAERLVEAESGISPEARKRRAWFGKNHERFQLTLGAGKVDGFAARIVDLGDRGLFARVPLRSPLDVPRGTLVAVRLQVEGRSEPVVVRGLVKGREVHDSEVELRLGIAYAMVLDTLPLATRRAIAPRDAKRVRPAPDQGVHVAIRGRSDAASVDGEVQDISVTGAGVRVQVPEARVAAWGRIVRVGVAHAGSPETVSSYAEIVWVAAGPQGVVLGLFFLEPDSAFEQSLAGLVSDADERALSRAAG